MAISAILFTVVLAACVAIQADSYSHMNPSHVGGDQMETVCESWHTDDECDRLRERATATAEARPTATPIPPTPTATPVPPVTEAPFMSVRRVDSTTVAFDWNSVSGATSYELERREGHFGSWTNVVTQTGRTFNTSDLESGVAYYYRVRGVNEKGPGPWSGLLPVNAGG